jgi:hypothetical protein
MNQQPYIGPQPHTYEQQPVQPQPAQQPVQSVTLQNNEAQVSYSKKITFSLDEETEEILSKIYSELKPHLINMAIKKFSETSEYSRYYLKKEFRNQSEIQVIQENEENQKNQENNFETTQSAPVTHQSQPQQQPAAQNEELTFSAW